MPFIRQVGPDGVARLKPGNVAWLVFTNEGVSPSAPCCECPTCDSCAPGDDNFSANLVNNGSFESPAVGLGVHTFPPNGWTVISGRPRVIHVDNFNSPSIGDGYPTAPDGAQILMGGFNDSSEDPPPNAVSVCEQDIDLSNYSHAIDRGDGCFFFSAKLGTYGPIGGGGGDQDDEPMLELIVGGVAIVTFGPLPGNIFQFTGAAADGKLDPGTTSVKIRYTGTLDPTAPIGYSNDAYVDDVRFHMCAPENS